MLWHCKEHTAQGKEDSRCTMSHCNSVSVSDSNGVETLPQRVTLEGSPTPQ